MAKVILIVLIASSIVSCIPITTNDKQKYCGYEMTMQEYTNLTIRAEQQGSAYEADSLWNIYDQLNDSIRAAMPDTVVFEIFLSLLNNNEVGLDIYVPSNKKFFEKISCAVMESNYIGKMPEQRYVSLYTYTNPDGSGDIPFEIAIKRKK